MTLSPRDYNGALNWMNQQSWTPTQDWTGLCQKAVRSAYGIPALFQTAYLQWLGADPEDRHAGGTCTDAPLGVALCFKGDTRFGHITLAARPFANGLQASWGTDLVERGQIDKHARVAPITVWGHRYLGYLTAINHYDLRLQPPKQTERYEAVALAVAAMERALETAVKQGDDEDESLIRVEIARLKSLYRQARHH